MTYQIKNFGFRKDGSPQASLLMNESHDGERQIFSPSSSLLYFWRLFSTTFHLFSELHEGIIYAEGLEHWSEEKKNLVV